MNIKLTSNSLESLSGCVNAIYNSERQIYECLKCNSGYIYVLNKKKCLTPPEVNLNNCIEVNNIGTVENSTYSCNKCLNDVMLN